MCAEDSSRTGRGHGKPRTGLLGRWRGPALDCFKLQRDSFKNPAFIYSLFPAKVRMKWQCQFSEDQSIVKSSCLCGGGWGRRRRKCALWGHYVHPPAYIALCSMKSFPFSQVMTETCRASIQSFTLALVMVMTRRVFLLYIFPSLCKPMILLTAFYFSEMLKKKGWRVKKNKHSHLFEILLDNRHYVWSFKPIFIFIFIFI